MKLISILLIGLSALLARAAVPEYQRNPFTTNLAPSALNVVTQIVVAYQVASNGAFVVKALNGSDFASKSVTSSNIGVAIAPIVFGSYFDITNMTPSFFGQLAMSSFGNNVPTLWHAVGTGRGQWQGDFALLEPIQQGDVTYMRKTNPAPENNFIVNGNIFNQTNGLGPGVNADNVANFRNMSPGRYSAIAGFDNNGNYTWAAGTGNTGAVIYAGFAYWEMLSDNPFAIAYNGGPINSYFDLDGTFNVMRVGSSPTNKALLRAAPKSFILNPTNATMTINDGSAGRINFGDANHSIRGRDSGAGRMRYDSSGGNLSDTDPRGHAFYSGSSPAIRAQIADNGIRAYVNLDMGGNAITNANYIWLDYAHGFLSPTLHTNVVLGAAKTNGQGIQLYFEQFANPTLPSNSKTKWEVRMNATGETSFVEWRNLSGGGRTWNYTNTGTTNGWQTAISKSAGGFDYLLSTIRGAETFSFMTNWVVATNGMVGIGTPAPGQPLDVRGNLAISNGTAQLILNSGVHSNAITTSDGFTMNFLQDGASMATLNNSGNFNATSLTLQGGQLFYKHGTGTNAISAGSSSVPTGSLLTSNYVALGNIQLRNNTVTPTAALIGANNAVLQCSNNFVYIFSSVDGSALRTTLLNP